MEIQSTPKVKCIFGLIYTNSSNITACIEHLEKVFGPSDMISEDYSFNITDYYENEMGSGLKKKFISFTNLIEAQKLSEIKRISNIIEGHYITLSGRSINLDPGYLDMDKFVLASTKYGRQKIYLNKGIYADPTLYFFKKEFHAYTWSFPDFTSGIYNDFFLKVRIQYKQQIKNI
ncbi:MAG: DUF4416 domain-containing protein [Candidatus Neomarinimicrobiota bacterium]|nr:MAG: DUF4416 domain-containing protein [Candidatus Neomarinimicrobiota bacterium]